MLNIFKRILLSKKSVLATLVLIGDAEWRRICAMGQTEA